MQECHPVAYESRKLDEAEHRYTTHEKELLAVVHCLRVWRHYLLGSSFIGQTDNTAVSHFLSQSKLTSKQARWQELLAEFNFMLEYRASSSNSVADALSRRAELDQKYEGPLTIVKKIGKMAYKVDPPHWWSHQLHPVFHVSMLKPFYEVTADPSRGQIKRQGLKPKAAGKRVAEAILNGRVITASHKHHQEYLVKWQGYMEEENTWERAADLSAYTNKAYQMQKLTRASTALVGENVTGCPLHPPSTVPQCPSSTASPRPSSTAPPRLSSTHPSALASSSSLASMHPSSTAPARPIAVPAHAKSQP
ncbi:hypothetical protein RJ639_007764 [Escallonia herrerae]|uniref:Chromo domain-containing protein n=1 Tax=Escallonia herrerae TaxID=1293975 RepID=A0AA88W0Y3_9ASTE|nr:hypothetical protein RJ639_007764 [Escallonia herrerae]